MLIMYVLFLVNGNVEFWVHIFTNNISFEYIVRTTRHGSLSVFGRTHILTKIVLEENLSVKYWCNC